MSSSGPIPRLFGPYVLTRHLGADALGSVYRAGTSSGPHLAPLLLVRVFDGVGVDYASLVPTMEEASEYLEEVRGPAVAKGAVLGIVEDVPFAGIEYVPGRTLDRLFSGEGQGSIPLPVEHALLIAEKLLVALEAGKPFEKKMGAPHGFLTPGFVSISNDGDVRVYGAGLGSGLLPSLKKASVLAAFGPYIAPEVLASGKPSAAGDIYSAAAILFQALTGKTPVPGAGTDALSGAVLALDGSPLPDDLGKLLARGLAKDPNQREKDVVAYRKTLGKLLYGGPYAPSTFNLAFFMHQRFEKAIDKERKELAQEETIDPRPLAAAEERKDKEARDRVQAARAAAAAAAVPVPSLGAGTAAGTTLGGTPIPKKSGLGGVPVPAVVGGVVVVLAVAGWLIFGKGGARPAAPPPTPVAAVATPTPMPAPTPMMVGKEDPEFQAQLQARLQEEMKKVESQIQKEQAAAAKKRADEQAQLEEAAQRTREAEEAARSARDRADKEEAERLAREAAEARAREDAARKVAEAAVPKVKEGDLVDIGQVTRPPQATKIVKPEATSIARTRKVGGTVLVRVLVDENGRAAQAEVYRDTNPKVGLGEASLTAVKQWQWTPATKDGVRVKTWIVVPLPFVMK